MKINKAYMELLSMFPCLRKMSQQWGKKLKCEDLLQTYFLDLEE